MPTGGDGLVTIVKGLRNPISVGMFGHAVTAVFRSAYFVHSDSPSGDLFLDPQFTEFDMPDLPHSSPVCNAFGCIGVGVYGY